MQRSFRPRHSTRYEHKERLAGGTSTDLVDRRPRRDQRTGEQYRLDHTSVNGRKLAEFNISTYGAIFSALKVRGFKIIGATFVTGSEQFEGTRATEFRMAGLDGGWRLWDTFQAWRNIVSAAAKANDMRLLVVTHCSGLTIQRNAPV